MRTVSAIPRLLDMGIEPFLLSSAVRSGMRSMFEDGLAKVLLGETTLEELARVAA